MAADESRVARTRAGSFAVLAAAAVWGTSGVAAALIPQINPLTTGAVTLGLGGVVLALTSARSLPAIFRAPGAWPLLLGGSIALSAYILAFFTGMALAGVALGTVIAIASAPIFVGAIELMADRRRPEIPWFAATTLTVVGGWMMVGGRDADSSSPTDSSSLVTGILSALVAGLCYAVFTYQTARLINPSTLRRSGLNERHVISAVQGLTVVPLFIVALVAGLPVASDVSAWSVLLYIAVIPTALGYLLYGRGLARVGASSAALYTIFEPVVATVLAVMLLGEALSVWGWTGIALVVSGLVILTVSVRGSDHDKDGEGASRPRHHSVAT